MGSEKKAKIQLSKMPKSKINLSDRAKIVELIRRTNKAPVKLTVKTTKR